MADRTATEIVANLGGIMPSDQDMAAYVATGTPLTCVLCTQQPCACPPFGTPEYFALINRRHGV